MAFATSKLPEWATRLAVFDTETTGIDTKEARLVTACIAEINANGEVTSQHDWLVDPGVIIPRSAEEVHGVSTQFARENGRQPIETIPEIIEVLQGYFRQNIPVVAYNASYDFGIMKNEAKRYGLPLIGDPAPVIDPYVIDKQVDKYRKGKRTLSVTAEFYGVSLEDAHNAGADAIAAGRLAQVIAAKFPDELNMSAMELHLAQKHWAEEQEASFHQYLVRNGRATGEPRPVFWPVR